MVRSDPDPEAQEKCLFTLGSLLYERRNYDQAVLRLQEALNKYPGNAEATRARFQLADSCRRLADQEHHSYLMNQSMSEDTRKHFLEEQHRWLRRAADEFTELAEFLQKPEARGHLSSEEQFEVPFLAADCLFNLGDYDKALARYEALAEQYRGRPEGLYALGGTARVWSARHKDDKVRQQLDEIRKNLSWLPPAKRPAWEAWLDTAGKSLTRPGDAGHGTGPGS
jgi:tetratricopeptide (TPR) repeat protein